MKTTKQKLYENLIFSLSFLIFSGLILSVIDAYLNIKNKTNSLYKSMAFVCSLFYGFVSYSIFTQYTADLPSWIYYSGIIGFGANILAVITLIASSLYKLRLETAPASKYFRGEESITTSSARA